MAKPLLFNGKPFDPNPPSKATMTLKEWFDSRPEGGVFSPEEIVREGVIGRSTISKFIADAKFPTYVHRWGPRGEVALGHPKEVARFKAMVKR